MFCRLPIAQSSLILSRGLALAFARIHAGGTGNILKMIVLVEPFRSFSGPCPTHVVIGFAFISLDSA